MNAGSPPDKSPILSGHPDWTALRALFPTLRHKAYLAIGSYGLLAKPVEAALRLYLDDRAEKGVDWAAGANGRRRCVKPWPVS